jgi:hypothetical protein
MALHPTALERAFQLTRSGLPNSVADIKKWLSLEGYAAAQVDGKALTKQLLTLIRAAQAPSPPDVARTPSR